MSEYHWCRWCEIETNWYIKRIGKRLVYVCRKCRNTKGKDGFEKSKKQYEEKLFQQSTEKLMEDPNMKWLKNDLM